MNILKKVLETKKITQIEFVKQFSNCYLNFSKTVCHINDNNYGIAIYIYTKNTREAIYIKKVYCDATYRLPVLQSAEILTRSRL